MSNLNKLIAQANAAVEAAGIDMNEAQQGGGSRILPEGYAFGRLVGYVEIGKQPQEFGGKAKAPALEFQLVFALFGEGYQNDDGTPYIYTTFPKALSRNEKSTSFKVFKALNWKGTAKGYAQLLNECFLVKIIHKKTKEGKVVSRIDDTGYLPPLDPVSKKSYDIPKCDDSYFKLFLWEFPTKEGWDSLYVDGTWDDGESKNRTQERILGALDFQGSPLQQLLGGGLKLPEVAQPVQAPQVPTLAMPTGPKDLVLPA